MLCYRLLMIKLEGKKTKNLKVIPFIIKYLWTLEKKCEILIK